MVFKESFISEGGEKYFTLGNYRSNKDSKIKPGYFIPPPGDTIYNSIAPIQITSLSLTPTDSKNHPLELGQARWLCQDSFLLLDAGAGFLSYAWSTGDTGRTLRVTKAGSYVVRAFYGCGYKTDTVLVKGYVPPAALLLNSSLLKCPAETVTVPAASGFRSYSWSNGTKEKELVTADTGTFVLTATGTEGCPARDSVRITTYERVKTFSLGRDTSFCLRKEISLSVQTQHPYDSVLWSNGSAEKSITVNEPGTYTAKVFNRCFKAQDTISVSARDCSALFIPNVFTPNNDGVNDAFRIVAEDGRAFRLVIYSRWGSQVFRDEEYHSGWQAEGVPDGVYFYELTDTEYDRSFRGNVQVMR